MRRTAHQHTEQPGRTPSPSGTQITRGSTSNSQRHTATHRVL
nr:MAG TPA: hypothetical protein [Caudoviricetes sp.]